MDISDPSNVRYVLISIFICCLGLGTGNSLAFTTGASLFPSLFTAQAFSSGSISGPFLTILSP